MVSATEEVYFPHNCPVALDFVAIDFETANSSPASPCAVGLVRVVEGKIQESLSMLFQPPLGYDWFHPGNIAIHGIKPQDYIAGDGFAAGTRVSSTAASSFTIFGTVTGFTGTATGSASFTRDMYDLPSDYKAMYSVRTLANNTVMTQVGRRLYDRVVANEQTTSTPVWYDLYMVGSVGKIRLLPPPNAADTLLMRYYRRMAVATSTADATVATDVPEPGSLALLGIAAAGAAAAGRRRQKK